MQHSPQHIVQQAIQELQAQRNENVLRLLKPLVKQKIVDDQLLNVLATALARLGKEKESQKQFKASLKYNPKNPQTHFHMATAFREQGKTDLAIQHFEKAFKLDSRNPRPLMEMALIWQHEENWEKAEKRIDHFLKVGGDPIEGNLRKGVCRYSLYQYEDAERLFSEADQRQPGLDITRYYQAMLYDKTKRKEEAEQLFLDLIAKQYQPAYFSLSLLYFSIGEWQKAFELYERRPVVGQLLHTAKSMQLAVWDGKTSLENKNILLYGEQGLGDQIRYLYFLEPLREVDVQITVACDKRLWPLIDHHFPGVQCIEPEQVQNKKLANHHYDFALCAGSLGRLYHDQLKQRVSANLDIESDFGFLSAPDDLIQRISKLLPQNGKPNIGISWRSIRFMQERNEWYLSAEEMAKLVAGLDANIVSLQYAVTEEERSCFETAGVELITVPDLDLKDDQIGLVALMSSLDTVASVSTALSELSGASGTPSIIFAVEDVRWFMSDLHIRGFYPNTKVFNKVMFGEWDDAITQARNHLEKWLSKEVSS